MLSDHAPARMTPLQRLATACRQIAGARDERLVLFTRFPEPGRTKTRMIPALGAEGAARLQREMAEHAMRTAGALQCRRRVRCHVRYEDGDPHRMLDWLGRDVSCVPQGPGDLGARMARAFGHAFADGADAVVIVGSDCVEATAELLDRAFGMLRRKDLVIGPAHDGGYYLIGLRRAAPGLFDRMPWGTGRVLALTRDRAQLARLSTRELPALSDVDRPEDLPVWERVCAAARAEERASKLSAIIPALNEAACIADAVASARRAPGAEVLVVDGGSTDDTADRAAQAGARVLTAARGRARQMNAGAEAACGRDLLFLHADALLPWGYDAGVRRALRDPRVAGGAFRLRIDGQGRALRLIERLANVRAARGGMPYGDQALFTAAHTFRIAGGYPDVPLMEDYEFVRRLSRLGRMAVLPAAVLTSARRWRRLGPLRASLLNQAIVAAHMAGVPPERLARWYGNAPP